MDNSWKFVLKIKKSYLVPWYGTTNAYLCSMNWYKERKNYGDLFHRIGHRSHCDVWRQVCKGVFQMGYERLQKVREAGSRTQTRPRFMALSWMTGWRRWPFWSIISWSRMLRSPERTTIRYRAIFIPADEVASFSIALSFVRGMNCPVELGPSLQVLHVPWIAKKLKIRQLGIGFCSFDWSKSWKDDNRLSGDFIPADEVTLFFSQHWVFFGEWIAPLN